MRKRQKRSSMNVTENGEKHSVLWRMSMSVTLESAVFMLKNYSDKWHSIKNTKDFTLKQMFDISTRCVSEQDEITRLETIGWENHSWKYLSLIGKERIINLHSTHKGLRLFGICIVSWQDLREPPIERCMGRKIGMVQSISGLQKI